MMTTIGLIIGIWIGLGLLTTGAAVATMMLRRPTNHDALTHRERNRQ